MHDHILTKEQKDLLPFIKIFSKDYYLVGGTAIALYLGHRRSIDFDLFTKKDIKRKSIKEILYKSDFNYKIIYESSEQMHIKINDVKVTFYQFVFPVKSEVWFEKVIKLPSLTSLAAMKAFALGGRGKWKDYVDLFFLLKYSLKIGDITNSAKQIFENSFNEKLFRQQLCYFKDIDYREEVEYIGAPVPEEDIKAFLTEVALQEF
jgi:hypothetical protein